MGIKNSSKATKIYVSDDEQSPIRAIFCLKNKTQNMAKIEEVEDCFILDFDPSQSPLINPKNSDFDDDNDLCLVSEKGQVACRDYPHPRHLCVKFPFEKTSHETYCDMCYCYVCEKAAPCKEWTQGLKHCDATRDGDKIWKLMKKMCKKKA